LTNIWSSFRLWLFQRRLQRFLYLQWDRLSGFDEKAEGWSFYLLARAFEDGIVMPKDAPIAFRLLLRSAQAGLPLGQICAGLAYLTGTGTPVDKMAAQVWWQAAAAQGDPGARVLAGIQEVESDVQDAD